MEYELRRAALPEAMKELRLRQGCILTWMEEDTSQPDLTVAPVWKWLVDG